jgi:predicted DNA binding protein
VLDLTLPASPGCWTERLAERTVAAATTTKESEMSTAVLEQVIQRAMDDQSFKEQIKSDPKTALGSYDLTAEEQAALTAGDDTKLMELGVQEKLSKAFRWGG